MHFFKNKVTFCGQAKRSEIYDVVDAPKNENAE